VFDWLVSFLAAAGVVSLIIWTVWSVLPLVV
jgi:hypothetical protein